MNKKIWSFLLVAVIVVAGIFFRFYPVLLSYFDGQARGEVYSQEMSTIDKVVAQKYPQMAKSLQARMVQEAFKDRLKVDKKEINTKIAQRAYELKSRYKDESGHIYLNGIDSYYWLRLLKNLLTTGHIGDRVVNGVEYDDLIAGPIDSATTKNVHLWLGFFFYKTASFFNKDVPLESTLFFIPIVLSSIVAIVSFYLAKKLGANDLGAFFASFLIALSRFFLERSIGEWFDTDIYNILFPLLIMTTFVYAFDNKSWLKSVLLTALSGLFCAFYASTWKGWWFIFDIMLLSGLFFILNQKLCQKEEGTEDSVIKRQLVLVGLFFVFSSFLVIALNSLGAWEDFLWEPLHLVNIYKVTVESQWPNVYQTVAELGRVKPAVIVQNMGGDIVFLGSLVGLIYIFLFERGLRNNHHGFGFLCVIFWLAGTFYASQEAMRFMLLLIVPVGLAFGLTVSKLYAIVDAGLRKHLQAEYASMGPMVVVSLLSFYLVLSMASIHKSLVTVVPQMNDTWYSVLTKIDKETPRDAIINSWWDFGHWFKAIAQRRVLFDGMTQNTPYAYWVAHGLLTDNEAELVGILRMINTSGNKAAEEIAKLPEMTLPAAVRIVKKAVAMKKEAAQEYLEKEFGGQEGAVILSYLFPKKLPVVYFIVSSDMFQKIGPISYIGNWDFQKVDMWFVRKHVSEPDFLNYVMKNYRLTQEEAESRSLEMSLLKQDEANFWFSDPWNYIFIASSAYRDDKLLLFDNGLVVNQNNSHAYWISDIPQNSGVPQSILFMEDGVMKETVQKNSTLSFSGLLMEDKDIMKNFLLDARLAKSMLVRLYYFRGEGLKYFKLFDKGEDGHGNAIYVYEVQWPKENEELIMKDGKLKDKGRKTKVRR